MQLLPNWVKARKILKALDDDSFDWQQSDDAIDRLLCDLKAEQ